MTVALELEKKIMALGRKKTPTYAVSLPKMWCKLQDLGRGDPIKQIVTGNAVIIIKDKEMAKKVLKALGIKKEGNGNESRT